MKTMMITAVLVIVSTVTPAIPALATAHSQTATQTYVTTQEGSVMMKAYQENDLKRFKGYLETADQETLQQYLILSMDHGRGDFVAVILEKMPADWNADVIAGEMVRNHSANMLSWLWEYTSAGKHPGWLEIAVGNGDADIASELLKMLPNTDAVAQAEKVYQNIRSASGIVSKLRSAAKLRHIAVFEVFRPGLSQEILQSYYEQAVKDGEADFSAYLKTKL